MKLRRPPSADALLAKILDGADKPAAFVLAGHNGSGKSTLWYERLASSLQLPLINADRLMMSILPERDVSGRIPSWAQDLRDQDDRWSLLAQESVSAFRNLVLKKRMPFAFETVFSHWKRRPDGTRESKADDILQMQAEGYVVVLLFVGLTSSQLSIARVQTRKQKGGHDVPINRLLTRFPRTQKAIRHAAKIADMTLMFDNSRDADNAFSLVRAQRRADVLFDVRDPRYAPSESLLAAAGPWMAKVVGPWRAQR